MRTKTAVLAALLFGAVAGAVFTFGRAGDVRQAQAKRDQQEFQARMMRWNYFDADGQGGGSSSGGGGDEPDWGPPAR